MANIDKLFPSKYLKAADLDNGDLRATIDSVTVEDVGGNGKPEDVKPVVKLRGLEKTWVLNKTNAGQIKRAYGSDTDHWSGKDVLLFAMDVEFSGNLVPAIRCRVLKDREPQVPLDDAERLMSV